MHKKWFFLFHVQVNGVKNLISIEQRQSIMLVPSDFDPQRSSSGELSEAAKVQGILPLRVLRCMQTWKRTEKLAGFFFKFAAKLIM